MASFNPPSIPTAAQRPAAFGGPVPIADSTAPTGTFAPGTKIQVGTHKVVIQKYFSEGGFAHVYLVKLPKPIDGTDIAVLKRVAVPDKENLANMRTEVETMKKLKGHRPIVTYYDSHASQLKGGGYEVFLLMEFCNGGGLIDFMNTRLQNRLTEPEILKIFSDVAEGVACMHYLKPPLLHRDLKVENVLINTLGGARRFKLCDFGSTAPPRPAATTPAECRLIEDDVQKHTTLQYRSPEMIDVYRKMPIDEKSDVWALGVLLYKLCYYTTPFETQGQLAILNASFKFPAHPVFSDKLKKLIGSMLKENPKSRPNIYQVLREACLMQGFEPPIKDIYAGRSQSEARRNQQLPSPGTAIASPPIGAVFAPPTQQHQVIPDVVPMRRGRPTTSSQGHVSKPSPSPGLTATSDPFAALDGKPQSGHVDEISNRFPSLDQFSLLHDGGQFDFDAKPALPPSPSRGLEQRVTERLADDAFAVSSKPAPQTAMKPSSTVSRAQTTIAKTSALQSVNGPSPIIHQPSPTRPVHSNYVSHGTMTLPAPPNQSKYSPSPRLTPSDHHRSTSLPRNQAQLHPEQHHVPPISPRLNVHSPNVLSPKSSFEGGRATSEALARARSTSSRPRPSSTYLESNMDYLREKEKSKEPSRPLMSTERRPSYSTPDLALPDTTSDDETNIESNVEYLRALEQEEATKNHRRHSGGHKVKRTSLPSLSGTKNLLAGKFGDAFKRFEHNASAPPGPRTPSPLNDMERRDLTPIAGSEATDGRSDDGNVLAEDMENMPPEQRREIERRRLSMEEKRVANAAAEYKKRLADRGSGMPPPKSIGGVSRATSIQNKVRNLLDESQQGSPPKKTADGYGKYTSNTAPIPQTSQFSTTQPALRVSSAQSNNPYNKPAIVRKPMISSPADNDLLYTKPRAQPVPAAGPAIASKTGGPRPSAPPKPIHLNSSNTGSNKEFLSGIGGKPTIQPSPNMSAQEREDYLQDFSRRFPSLRGIELVEREIGLVPTSPDRPKGGAAVKMEDRGLRSRDV